MSRGCLHRLRELLGPHGVRDPAPVHVRLAGSGVQAVTMPADATEVARIIDLASREGWRVAPAGAATWPDGGGLGHGVAPAIVISSRRMTRLVAYEPADLTVTVEAGATLAEVQEAVGAHDQWLPMDPPPDDTGTVGAVLATGSAGPLAHGFGGPRDLALGLGLVTGDGRTLALGGRVVKNVAGFDLVRLTVGSWGAIGVITQATLRLFPRPEREATVVVTDPSTEALDEIARGVASGPVEVAAVEVLRDSAGNCLAVRVLGSTEEVEDVLSGLDRTCPAAWKRATRDEAMTVRARTRGWSVGSTAAIRLRLLPSRVPELRRHLADLAGSLRPCGLSVHATVYDAASGSLQVALEAASRGPAEGIVQAGEVLEQAARELRAKGGSLRVVRGPPELFPSRVELEPAVERLVRGTLDAFDPGRVLPRERFLGAA